MELAKNKTTAAGREFWTHVEAVAQRVRHSQALANYRVAKKAIPDARVPQGKCEGAAPREGPEDTREL